MAKQPNNSGANLGFEADLFKTCETDQRPFGPAMAQEAWHSA